MSTIAVSSPVPFQTFQRDGSSQASITVTGTYTGSPTHIEASFNGGAYATIVASPSGGTFSGTLTLQAMGQGTLTVRFTNDTTINTTVATVKIGDVYVVFGQSNHVGHGLTSDFVPPSTSLGNASIWAVDGSWRELVETVGEPFSNRSHGVQCSAMNQTVVDGTGSYFGALATLIMQRGVPVAFVPCAVGSSAISTWQPGANHFNAGTLYGSATTRSQSVGNFKAALWWQGEADSLAATSYTTYLNYLNALVNAWYTDTGKQVVVYVINRVGDGTLAAVQDIQNAQIYCAANNTHALAGPNMDQAWPTNVHYQTTGDINTVAQRAFDALVPLFYTPSLTGDTSASAAGTPVASSSVALTGSTATGNAGFVSTALGGILTAAAANGTAGVIGVGVSLPITGAWSTSYAGAPGANIDAAATGVSGGGITGSSSLTKSMTGCAAGADVGFVVPGNASARPSGGEVFLVHSRDGEEHA